MSTITETKKTARMHFDVRSLTVIGMLSALAVILMLFEIPLGFAPDFYKIDLSEVPVLIGAFAIGPIAGVMIELIKILLNLLINGTVTAGIGEAANFVIGCALVLPSAIVYHRTKNKKGAAIGLVTGVLCLIVAGSLLNAFVLLPTYAKVFHMPLEALVGMGTAVNPRITSLTSFVLFAVAPFNLIKGAVVSVITFLLYKPLSPVIKGQHKA